VGFSVDCYVLLLLHFSYKENREKMARLSISFGLMLLILSCGAICSSALTPFSLEDKLQELEVRLVEKVTQLEAQLELNVSILFSLI
jgi:hypothetical protein